MIKFTQQMSIIHMSTSLMKMFIEENTCVAKELMKQTVNMN